MFLKPAGRGPQPLPPTRKRRPPAQAVRRAAPRAWQLTFRSKTFWNRDCQMTDSFEPLPPAAGYPIIDVPVKLPRGPHDLGAFQI